MNAGGRITAGFRAAWESVETCVLSATPTGILRAHGESTLPLGAFHEPVADVIPGLVCMALHRVYMAHHRHI